MKEMKKYQKELQEIAQLKEKQKVDLINTLEWYTTKKER